MGNISFSFDCFCGTTAYSNRTSKDVSQLERLFLGTSIKGQDSILAVTH